MKETVATTVSFMNKSLPTELREQFKQWIANGDSTPKIAKTILLARKVMLIVFCY